MHYLNQTMECFSRRTIDLLSVVVCGKVTFLKQFFTMRATFSIFVVLHGPKSLDTVSPQRNTIASTWLIYVNYNRRNFSAELFSIECGKTKTKVISLTNHNRRKQRNKPIKIQSKNMSSVRSAEKHVRPRHIGFGFAFHWLRKWREFC